MERNLNVQGFVLLDVDVVALNNAGKDTISNNDNITRTKSINKDGQNYVYVSGQAWRYWWRETLQYVYGWTLSPITRGKSIVFTNTNPIDYPDDDVFGYMRAASETNEDEKGKKKTKNITVTRVSPLKNSALISVAATRPAMNWSSMSRQEGDSVPFVKQEYSAVMKGMFSLDINAISTFSDYNRSGYRNLSDDLFGKGKLLRLPQHVRKERIADTIAALKNISGGAMQTSNMGDVTPKLIILVTSSTGNHPFSHIVKNAGERNERVVLNMEGLRQVLIDYKDTFVGKLYIGRRSGFFDEYDEDIKTLVSDFDDIVVYQSINIAVDEYIKEVKTLIE